MLDDDYTVSLVNIATRNKDTAAKADSTLVTVVAFGDQA
jgi:hypothetical protein